MSVIAFLLSLKLELLIWFYSNTVVHQRAIGVVSNLLYCHDLDPRINDPLMRSKIAQLYLPLISIACDVLDQLWNPSSTARTGASGEGIDLSVARAISTSNVPGARPIGYEMALKVSLSPSPHLFCCYCIVTKPDGTKSVTTYSSR